MSITLPHCVDLLLCYAVMLPHCVVAVYCYAVMLLEYLLLESMLCGYAIRIPVMMLRCYDVMRLM